MSNDRHTGSPPITDLLFLYFLFPGKYIAHHLLWQVRWRKIEESEFSCFTTSTAGPGLGVSPFQRHESPVILHLSHCHSLVKQDLFFSKRKKDMILSLIFLYLSEPVIENRAVRSLRAERWVLNADRAKHKHTVYKCLLIIFGCFLLYFHFWWAVTFDKQQTAAVSSRCICYAV